MADAFWWSWGGKGTYSAKSCYLGMFRGEVAMAGALKVWKSRAPAKCRFFLWLVLRDRCWTVERLERRGLSRPLAFPLCDQAQESIAHLLLGCVLARSVSRWCVGACGSIATTLCLRVRPLLRGHLFKRFLPRPRCGGIPVSSGPG
jgi:hypothetical protein